MLMVLKDNVTAVIRFNPLSFLKYI